MTLALKMNKPLFYFALACGILGIIVGVLSLVMPDILVYAQNESEDPLVQAARIAQQEMNLRGNATTKDASEPILYNSIPEGDIAPFPME